MRQVTQTTGRCRLKTFNWPQNAWKCKRVMIIFAQIACCFLPNSRTVYISSMKAYYWYYTIRFAWRRFPATLRSWSNDNNELAHQWRSYINRVDRSINLLVDDLCCYFLPSQSVPGVLVWRGRRIQQPALAPPGCFFFLIIISYAIGHASGGEPVVDVAICGLGVEIRLRWTVDDMPCRFWLILKCYTQLAVQIQCIFVICRLVL